MCGIAGAIDMKARRKFPTERLLWMARALQHRGPDDEYVYEEPGLSMAARRLSIIDLESGRQPIGKEDCSIWVAFNGELFEYPEVRRTLLANGHHLKTHCDTEAWVHLYEDLREAVFEYAKGQFAVSLWDQKQRTLYLARDRVGISPLYYTEQDGWLLWASEIKALIASGLVISRPDPKGIDYIFNFFCASTSRTCFEGINSLPPGHFLKVSEHRSEVRCYWDLDFPDVGSEKSMDDPELITQELDELLRRAIRRRLRADVPVVSYLSGGLDSSVILGLAAREMKKPIPAFTVGLEGVGPDERTLASDTARLIGSPLHVCTMNQARITAAYPDLITAAESPVLDTSCACLLILADSVHNHNFKVAITGEGGDEALAGYIWYKLQKVFGYLEKFGKGIIRQAVFKKILHSIADHKVWPHNNHVVPGVRFAQQEMYAIIGQGRAWFYSADLWEQLRDYSAYQDVNLPGDRICRWHPLNQSLYLGYKILLSGHLMKAKGDHVAMRSSIETRYPLLDEDLIQYCTEINPNLKLRRLKGKWLLRNVARRALPPAIARRRKTMFRSDRSSLFLTAARPDWVDQLLSPPSLKSTGYFDPEGIKRAITYLERPSVNLAKRLALDMGLVGVISTQLWHHKFCGGGLADLPTWNAK